jgi:hypothetical protein
MLVRRVDRCFESRYQEKTHDEESCSYGISLTLMVIALARDGAAQDTGDERVVLVCEHGAAKSVIATVYFNKLAAERG